ncbi:MAG: hypothetical protein IK990_19755 [Ruminiclostridium sp.]|nr:hypothetical protein [Ruminiclostridium sp.]
MAEEEKKDSKSKIIIIVLIAVVLVLAAAVTLVFLSQNNSGVESDGNETVLSSAAVTSTEDKNPLILDYDGSAIALNADDLNKMIDQQKVDVGEIALEYQNIALSENGTDFSCHLANSEKNTEDMFIAIYTDATYAERIYLSGLLAPGTVIEDFKSEISFEPGVHEVVTVFTTVADDHQTMTGQISVVVKLDVG